MTKWIKHICILLGMLIVSLTTLHAQVSMALLPFQDKGDEVKGEGDKLSDFLFAFLSAYPEYYLVEREDLDLALSEQEMSLSPMVNPGEAIQLGQITGARILVTGSIVEAGRQKFLIAKLISSETSRVVGVSVKGSIQQDTSELAEQLAAKIAQTLEQRAEHLLPRREEPEDRAEQLRKQFAGKSLPAVKIAIKEIHIGSNPIDPAAQTELQRLALAAGFPMQADNGEGVVMITGEAFSEFAMRRGNLVFVKARVEVKAVHPNGEVLAADRQTYIAADLAEHIAGKTALQEATAELASRFLSRLVAQESP